MFAPRLRSRRFRAWIAPSITAILAALACALSADGSFAKDAPPAKAGAAPKGAPSGEVTYSKHIASILWKNCAACHRPGEVGPFSLLTYEDASKRADFLAEITADRRMPPWKAEPDFGKFRDERRLSDRDIGLIGRWAEAGAPEGNPKDLPKPPKFADGWQLGEPDLVLKMPEPFDVPAGGSDVYRCFVIPIPIDKDKMVSGVEFRPGNRKVVHHAIMYLDANGAARAKDEAEPGPGFVSFGGPGITPTGGLGGWAPGSMPRFMPEGIVKYVKKGSDLVLQVHYHPDGKAETDQSLVGVHFSKVAAKKIVTGIAVMQTHLEIPADDAHCEIKADSLPLPVEVTVMGVSPHMHNLGREIKVTATRPGRSDEVPLVWIKDWDFNWQGAYQFEKPIRLPKGSTIHVVSIYDNSSANPKNPNKPSKKVLWGEQTSDEMCLCGVQVTTETIGDLKQIARMKGNELGAGLDGGVPGQATDAKKKDGPKKAVAKRGTPRATAARAQAKQAEAGPASPPNPDAATGDVGTQSPPVTNAPAQVVTEPANAKLAVGKKPKKVVPEFPAEGAAIPEDVRIMLSKFDLDGNGKMSLEEFNKLPPELKMPIRERLLLPPKTRASK